MMRPCSHRVRHLMMMEDCSDSRGGVRGNEFQSEYAAAIRSMPTLPSLWISDAYRTLATYFSSLSLLKRVGPWSHKPGVNGSSGHWVFVPERSFTTITWAAPSAAFAPRSLQSR